MNNIKKLQTTNNPFTHWANTVVDNVNAKTTACTNELRMKQTGYGQTLSLHPKYKYNKNNFTTYRGEFDPTASYSPNDIVRVMPSGSNYPIQTLTNNYELPWESGAKTIVSENGVTYNLGRLVYGSNGEIFSTFYEVYSPVMAGVWMCVAPIPDPLTWISLVIEYTGFAGQLLNADLATQLANNPFYAYNIDSIRLKDINYRPIWPEKTNIATDQDKNGRYWELISLLPQEVTTCVNGQTITSYVDSALSGSITGSI